MSCNTWRTEAQSSWRSSSRSAIDEATLQPYFYGVEEIELRKAGDYLILNIASHDEGGD
jgi:hypothetical protein